MAHYLITGHTGFKGAWLIFLLKAQGHDVSGLALDPLPGSIFDRTNLENDLVHDFRVDIRNKDETVDAFVQAQPDYVIHMAAQALVRESYARPRYTYEVNVNGTLNILEAIESIGSVIGHLVVTSDKVYQESCVGRPFVETDPLGGKDPYGTSKAMADLLTQEHLQRPGSKPGAIVRAGNVIGLGDVSKDRLLPDIFRAVDQGVPVRIRNRHHIRPWQHVLDCLNGYLWVLHNRKPDSPSVFNIGPVGLEPMVGLSVEEVSALVKEIIPEVVFEFEELESALHENPDLKIDSSLVNREIGWFPTLDTVAAIQWAFQQHKAVRRGMSQRETIEVQISDFLKG